MKKLEKLKKEGKFKQLEKGELKKIKGAQGGGFKPTRNCLSFGDLSSADTAAMFGGNDDCIQTYAYVG